MQFGISPYSINMIQLPTLELGRGWQAQRLLPRQTCFEQHLWGHIITAMVRLAQEHAPGQPAKESGY